MTLFIDPAIGEMRIAEVERKDIAKLHFDLRDKPYQANRTLGVLSKMFSLAEIWGLRPDGSNPCRHVKRYKESKRERFLSPEETERLGEILREAESEMPSAVAAFRLLLLTGCRLSEIQFLRWEYVKDDCIELPDAKTGETGRAARSRGPRRAGGHTPRGRQPLGHPRQAAGLPSSPIYRGLGVASARAPIWRMCEFMTCVIQLCFQSPGTRREPHDDREAARSHAGADDCPICALGSGTRSRTLPRGSPGASAGTCRPLRVSKIANRR